MDHQTTKHMLSYYDLIVHWTVFVDFCKKKFFRLCNGITPKMMSFRIWYAPVRPIMMVRP